MASTKIIIQRNPSIDEPDSIFVYIVHNNKSVEVFSDEQGLVDFYCAVIAESSISKEVLTDSDALLRIVSFMYGGTVSTLPSEYFTDEEFHEAIRNAKNSRKFTL